MGFFPYTSSALRGGVRPNPISWIIWSLNGAVLTVAYFLAGGTPAGAGVPLSQTIGPGILAVVAAIQLSHERRALTLTERSCAMLAAVVLGLSIVTENAAFALTCGFTVEVFAAVPTLIHIWRKPQEECLSAWVLFSAASIINVAGLGFEFRVRTLVPWFFVLQTSGIALMLCSRIYALREPAVPAIAGLPRPPRGFRAS